MGVASTVIVEFYGIPRLRAQKTELTLSPGTVGETLAAVERACPGLGGLVQQSGRLAPQYLISLNGQEFGPEFSRRLKPGDRLLLLSADAGG
jgi:molybdopterin converting factor small subunit